MGNAGRHGGEYYTPRPLIRAMLAIVEPQSGETIYDGALGSAGFLCESFERLNREAKNVADRKKLQTSTFYGQEKKPLAYVIGLMNMVLHGIEAPNIIHTNTLDLNNNDIQEKDRHDVIFANPPFGGRTEVQQNFPSRHRRRLSPSSSTSSASSAPVGALALSSRTHFSPIRITRASRSRNCSSNHATCTRSSTAPAARSRARV